MPKPFLKWAGGKRWLVHNPQAAAPSAFRRYLEPFLGGGAMFFKLVPESAVLSDLNADLIETYIAVRDHCSSVEDLLNWYNQCHSRDTYYDIRKHKPRSPVERAARFIYLNRTCWNGLYRVNRKGEFNVPIGTKVRVTFNEGELKSVAEALNGVTIVCNDFEQTVALAREGDFLFVDPPYTANHNANGFLKYNESIFSWSDQERLLASLKSAAARGAMIVVTNADHKSVRDLYHDFGTYVQVERTSVLAGLSSRRGGVTEALFRANF